MTPKYIVAKFANALKQFKQINGQLLDTNLTLIRDVLASLLLQIPYYRMKGTHNLVVLIQPVSDYATRYGREFAKPEWVRAYDAIIDNNATAIVRVRTEAAHKAKRSDRGTYETARRETVQFILNKGEDERS